MLKKIWIWDTIGGSVKLKLLSTIPFVGLLVGCATIPPSVELAAHIITSDQIEVTFLGAHCTAGSWIDAFEFMGAEYKRNLYLSFKSDSEVIAPIDSNSGPVCQESSVIQ